jgi:hypothetical protein
MSFDLRSLEKGLYLASRTVGDINAAKRGPDVLAKRVVKRQIHRGILSFLSRKGLW